jgi:membrane associated rhomboid family serine protease
MIPVDDGPRRVRRLPVVTVCLLILNVSVFLYEVSLGAGAEQFIRTYGAVPREILTGQDIPPAGPDPLWLQLLTSMFLHGGWLHLIGNMIYLCIFGDDIEDVLGHGPYLLFYLGAGVAASLVQLGLSGPGEARPSVGASGAIAGVLGAYLVFFPRRRIQVIVPVLFFATAEVSALILLGFWFLLQFLNGIAALGEGTAQIGGVAVWAHIGGFVTGVLVALLMRSRFALGRQAYT